MTSSTRQLLRVSAPHFVAGAIWEKRGHAWHCTRAAPILQWMGGMTAAQAGNYLAKKGWSFEWVASGD